METIQKIWNKKFVLLFITNLLVLAAFYASIPIGILPGNRHHRFWHRDCIDCHVWCNHSISSHCRISAG